MKPLLIGAALLLSTSAQAAPPSPFQALLNDHWNWSMRNNPVYATELGDRRFDAELGSQSVATMDRQAAELQQFLRRAQAMDRKKLSAADQLNQDIFIGSLKDSLDGNSFPQRLMLFTNRGGWHSYFAGLPDSAPFFTLADYKSYIARLKAYPRFNEEGIATTKAALAAGMVQPCEPMVGFEKTIDAHVVKDASQSVFWQPFAKKPDAISNADWSALKSEAQGVIMQQVVPAYARFAQFYRSDYQPDCRKTLGASAMPQGAGYYDWRIKSETTTNLTAQQIHKIGLDEVARIRSEMEAVIKGAGFVGSRADYVAKLRSDPAYYAKTAEELMTKTSALMKQVDGEMPRLFGTLARLPYTVKPIPEAIAPGNTTAYYEPGAAATGRPGIYRVNTTELGQRPLFELPALSLHEAVPGHHHQIALQQELPLPAFRKNLVFYTAFVEGWGLYSERLGIEMGIYDTPEKDYGRLSYEMWRACRLVVDTGLHAMGWSKAQAVAFMRDNTALSEGNIDAEVNRYITWPGQALAYKLGELRIRALRSEAEQKLGSRFDLRAFHDRVLENGPVPLSILESHVKRWIAKQEKRS
jgi:uncharacterized protein (DUF885 family)